MLKRKKNSIAVGFIIQLVAFFCFSQNSQRQSIYYSTCDPSTDSSRLCNFSDNFTAYLYNLKSGGSNYKSSSNYLNEFIMCEQFTFDCGYVENSTQFIEVSNGISLDMDLAVFNSLSVSNTLKNKIRPYLKVQGERAACALSVFPLTLTPAQSNQFLNGYLDFLSSQVQTLYMSQKIPLSQNWTFVNVNIKQVTLQAVKQRWITAQATNLYWQAFLLNKYQEMAKQLKQIYRKTKMVGILHASYSIDSTLNRCRPKMSLNFLVDQSGSLTPTGFQLAIDFLISYVNNTKQDTTLMSIHFYDSNFNPKISYGNSKSQIISALQAKIYGALGTATGTAISAMTTLIQAQNFSSQIQKKMIVITDGASGNDVTTPSNVARSKGIELYGVGVGAGQNPLELNAIAGSPQNYISISSYSQIKQLSDILQSKFDSIFCKKIILVNLGDFLVGQYVPNYNNPKYYRIPKSVNGQYFQLDIYFYQSAANKNQNTVQSHFDPFPDEFSQYEMSEHYMGNETHKVYFIAPVSNQNLRIRKQFTKLTVMDTSYIAMRGVDMRYNLTLKLCNTLLCQQQRKMFKPNPQIQYNPPQQDLFIFAYIAGAVLIMCVSSICLICFLGSGNDQQEKKKKCNKNNQSKQMILEGQVEIEKDVPVNKEKQRQQNRNTLQRNTESRASQVPTLQTRASKSRTSGRQSSNSVFNY